MKTVLIIAVSVLAGIGVFAFIAKKFGIDCIPGLTLYGSVGTGALVFWLLNVLL